MALQDQLAVGFAYCGEICVFVHAERRVGIRGKRIRHNDRPFVVASRRWRLNEVVKLVFIQHKGEDVAKGSGCANLTHQA